MSDQPDTAAVLAAIKQIQVSVDAHFDRVDARLDRIDARLDHIDARLDGIDARLDSLDGQVAGLRVDVDALAARLDKLESGFTAFRTDMVDELGRTRADLMDRISRLQNDLAQVRDENFVNYALLERMERVARGTQEEGRGLADQVSTMYRLVRRLEQEVRELRERH